jgi:hypothetical protein
MPLNFPFRRKAKMPPNHTAELKTELNEAIAKLTEFSAVLRRELAVANEEENRLNPVPKKPE